MNLLTSKKLLVTLVSSALLSACGSSSDGGNSEEPVTLPIESSYETVVLDASDGSQAAYLDLISGSEVTDDSWQLAYQKYIGFKLNGGISGDGEVSACIAHQYTALFDADGNSVVDEFKALSADSTLANFEAVDTTSCTEFEFDTLKTQIELEDWLDADYSQGAPVYSAKIDNGWIIRAADGSSYARVKVKSVDVVFGATTSRQAVLTSELWNGSIFETAIDSPILDFSSDRVFWDLETNALVTESDEWDLSLMVDGQDYPMQLNGGASGSGSAGAGAIIVSSIDDVTDPTDTTQVYSYFTDTADGVLSTPGSYGPLQYAVDGGHLMWPTFTTYLIKDESDGDTRLFKLQLLSNYGESGELASANLAFRYSELTE